MPELAEVAFASKQWQPALNHKITDVVVHPSSRVFRNYSRELFINQLRGETFTSAQTHGKQMLFRFSKNVWLGIHLGMTGSLMLKVTNYPIQNHDALLLKTINYLLVFKDPRQFGQLRIDQGANPPDWWSKRPVSMLDERFNINILQNALSRHKKRPLKALLLDQRYFPGMGNWMADEVLWRARMHPAELSGKIKNLDTKTLFKKIRFVTLGAMKSIGEHGGDPPRGWLFHSRWRNGEKCPKSQATLIREKIGGRTTCWSPSLQKKI